MKLVRAFLAIPLSEATRRKLNRLLRQLAQDLPEVRWSNLETLHLTLRFFGDLTEETLEKIGGIMLSIGLLHAPFVATLGGLGVFPAPQRARVFWLGVYDRGELKALHADLYARLPELGIPREPRPFTPHLTLGRHRGRGLPVGPVLERHQEEVGEAWSIDRLVLFESRLQSSGALHLPRRSIHLDGGGADATGPAGS